MRLLLPTLLAVLVVMTNGMVVPNDKSDMIRRSPDEKNIQTKSVEQKCYVGDDFCARSMLGGRFQSVWPYSNVQRFYSVNGVFPSFAGSFSSFTGWDHFADGLAALVNTCNAYGDYFHQNQLTISTVRQSLYNFISTFDTLANGCYNGYQQWGPITRYQVSIGNLYAQFWQVISGFFSACDARFGIDQVLPPNTGYYSQFSDSLNVLNRIQPFSNFGPYTANRYIDFPWFQSHKFPVTRWASWPTKRGYSVWGSQTRRIYRSRK